MHFFEYSWLVVDALHAISNGSLRPRSVLSHEASFPLRSRSKRFALVRSDRTRFALSYKTISGCDTCLERVLLWHRFGRFEFELIIE